MTDKELRRLSRSELLEMLIAQTEENSQLKIRLKQAEAQLRDRRIEIDKAGSLAEAALSLNGVFQAAEAAAQQYLENIQRISSQQDAISRVIKEQSEKRPPRSGRRQRHTAKKYTRMRMPTGSRSAARASKLLADQEALRQLIQSAGEVEINEEHSKSAPRASNPGTARNGA